MKKSGTFSPRCFDAKNGLAVGLELAWGTARTIVSPRDRFAKKRIISKGGKSKSKERYGVICLRLDDGFSRVRAHYIQCNRVFYCHLSAAAQIDGVGNCHRDTFYGPQSFRCRHLVRKNAEYVNASFTQLTNDSKKRNCSVYVRARERTTERDSKCVGCTV